MSGYRAYKCLDCKHQWELTFGPILPGNCPKCHSKKIKHLHEAKDQKPGLGLNSARKGLSAGRKGRFWQDEE